MIEQKKFRASYEIHSNQDLEHNFLYIFFFDNPMKKVIIIFLNLQSLTKILRLTTNFTGK